MSILVYADHNNSSLKSPTLNVISAAKAIGEDITVLVAGESVKGVADEAAKIDGVSKVLLADSPVFKDQLPENVSKLVADLGKNYGYILSAANSVGKNFMPRVAALLDSDMISDVTKVVSKDTFERPIYAGNAIATVKTDEPIKIMTIRTTAFDPASPTGGSASVETVTAPADSGKATFVSEELAKSDRPELGSARVVVSGGRALGSAENFKKVIEPLADKLGAAVGASRAAVDAGYAPNDLQVGQTGKIVAPDLYIAAGISGAIQHLAGMKDSKVIVAINKDPEAPISQVADYFLEGDVFNVLPELASKL